MGAPAAETQRAAVMAFELFRRGERVTLLAVNRYRRQSSLRGFSRRGQVGDTERRLGYFLSRKKKRKQIMQTVCLSVCLSSKVVAIWRYDRTICSIRDYGGIAQDYLANNLETDRSRG